MLQEDWLMLVRYRHYDHFSDLRQLNILENNVISYVNRIFSIEDINKINSNIIQIHQN